jgi:hypothetical protein
VTDQPALFDMAPLVQPTHASRASIDERFTAFHHANRWVYQQLEVMTAELLLSGQTRVGMKMLIEVLRWRYFRQTFDTSSGFRLNNDYTSRYARLLLATHPEWDGVFEIRALASERAA